MSKENENKVDIAEKNVSENDTSSKQYTSETEHDRETKSKVHNVTRQTMDGVRQHHDDFRKMNEVLKGEPITVDNYKDYVFKVSPKSSHWKNMFWAFLIGGLICVIGQAFIYLYEFAGFDDQQGPVLASSTLVLIAALLTGFGVYDKIGRFAGAGSTIPITGFSNAIVAPALEFRAEGYIYGIGAKLFLVAGPVIVNGVFFAVLIAMIRLAIGV